MPPIEVQGLRAVGGIDSRVAPRGDARNEIAVRIGNDQGLAKPAVSVGEMLDPGAPPVNAGRVAEIRKAVASGSYVVNPAGVVDAMIAAGLLLRSAK